mgnify:FL=1
MQRRRQNSRKIREYGRKNKQRQNGSRWIKWVLPVVLLCLLLGTGVYWFLNGSVGEKGEGSYGALPLGAPYAKAGIQAAAQVSGKGTDAEEAWQETRIQRVLESMTLEEKVNQLFMITPEALTGVGTVIQAGDGTREALEEHPVGGLIYFAQNLKDPDQTRTMLENTQEYASARSGFPIFLSVDEEGGQVARVGSNPAFGVPEIGNMSEVGAGGDTQEAYETGSTIGAYLKDLGFNMDAAPDADVLTNPANEVVKYRSFGSDPELVSRMAAAELKGLNDQGIIGMYKHFPGHGGTTADSHEGYVYVEETLEELKSGALVPFQDGADNGLQVIMVSHIACPEVTGDNTPATLSRQLVTDLLREDMGFDGLVITDALNMGAITEQYSSGEAAVAALNAGVDMLLMPADFQAAYDGVMAALENGGLTEERIDESVRRILEIKLEME